MSDGASDSDLDGAPQFGPAIKNAADPSPVQGCVKAGDADASRIQAPPQKYDRPKPLRGDAVLIINTDAAQQAFFGRPAGRAGRERAKRQGRSGYRRAEIPGVPLFATLIQVVIRSAAADDPYADLMLLKIEETFADAEKKLLGFREEVEVMLAGRGFLDLKVALSQKPLRKQLRFRSSYSYWAARLVADYDRLAVAILSAHHYALLPKPRADALLGAGRRVLRGAFQLPRQFKASNVRRSELLEETDAGRKAIERFGAVPDDVLQRQRMPAFGPSALRHRQDDDERQEQARSIPDVL